MTQIQMSPSKLSSTSSNANCSGAAATSASISSPPANHSESAVSIGYHKERMQNAHEALATGSIYLGEPGVTNNVTWVHVGKADQLVTNETTTLQVISLL